MANRDYDRNRRPDTGTDYRYYRQNEFRRSGGRQQDRGQYMDDYEASMSGDWWEDYDAPAWEYTEIWVVPGPYTGIGPKGYQRSDERIRDEIVERLTYHGHLDATDIDVEVRSGEVTLTGSVNSRREKRLAEDIADSVMGVDDIHNELKINRQPERHRQEQFQVPEQRQGEIKPGRERQTQGQMEKEQARRQPRKEQQGQPQAGDLKSKIKQDMDVQSADGKRLGRAINITGDQFQLDRHGALDLFIPFSAVQSVEDGKVILKVKASEVDKQGWAEEKEGRKA